MLMSKNMFIMTYTSWSLSTNPSFAETNDSNYKGGVYNDSRYAGLG